MLTQTGGYVYIMTNLHHTTLYIGVASSLSTRVDQHRVKENRKSFTARYNISKLVYFEFFDTIESAIEREKTLKKYSASRKRELVTSMNKEWRDLYEMIAYH
jgi:putative endonuclease